jgi:hypothetical protein
VGLIKCECGQIAHWIYLPSSEQKHPFYCDDCIISKDSAGCSCNWEDVEGDRAEIPTGVEGIDWAFVDPDAAKRCGYNRVEPKQLWQKLQENGKPWPCCEYLREPDGFNEEDYDDLLCK